MGIVRAETIARMRGAFRKGVSASRFISDMKVRGLTYRRADMLADWRTVNEIEKKEGLVRFIRKDRYPSKDTIAAVTWEMSQEFMYKVKVQSVIKPGEPIIDKFVNIMSDVPMTPAMIEAEVVDKWAELQESVIGERVGFQVFSVFRRTVE